MQKNKAYHALRDSTFLGYVSADRGPKAEGLSYCHLSICVQIYNAPSLFTFSLPAARLRVCFLALLTIS